MARMSKEEIEKYTMQVKHQAIKQMVGSLLKETEADTKYVEWMIQAQDTDTLTFPKADYFIAQILEHMSDDVLQKMIQAKDVEEMIQLAREEKAKQMAEGFLTASDTVDAAAAAAIRLQNQAKEAPEEDRQVLNENSSRIAELNRELTEARRQLQEKDTQLNAKDTQLNAKDRQLDAKDNQLAVKDEQILSRDKRVDDQRTQIQRLEKEIRDFEKEKMKLVLEQEEKNRAAAAESEQQAEQLTRTAEEAQNAYRKLAEEEKRSAKYLAYLKYLRDRLAEESVSESDTEEKLAVPEKTETAKKNTEKPRNRWLFWLNSSDNTAQGREEEVPCKPEAETKKKNTQRKKEVSPREYILACIHDKRFDIRKLEFMTVRYTDNAATLEELEELAVAGKEYEKAWEEIQSRRCLLDAVHEAQKRRGEESEITLDEIDKVLQSNEKKA